MDNHKEFYGLLCIFYRDFHKLKDKFENHIDLLDYENPESYDMLLDLQHRNDSLEFLMDYYERYILKGGSNANSNSNSI